MLTPTRKNVLLIYQISSVIYKIRYQCDAGYFGRTGQNLETQINQHVSLDIRKGKVENLHRCVNVSDSAIAEHLIRASSVLGLIAQVIVIPRSN